MTDPSERSQELFNPLGSSNLEYTPEQAARKAALVAKAKRQAVRNKDKPIEVDERDLDEILHDTLAALCEEHEWELDFVYGNDDEGGQVTITRGALAFKIFVDYTGSGIEQGMFAHQFNNLRGLLAALDQDFDFVADYDGEVGDIDDQYGMAIEHGVLGKWQAVADDDNPDFVTFYKNSLSVLAVWDEDENLKGNINYRLSSFADVYPLLVEYGKNGTKNAVCEWS